jgi:hypothetical protein
MTEAMFKLVVADPVDTPPDRVYLDYYQLSEALLPSPRTRISLLFQLPPAGAQQDYLRHRRAHGISSCSPVRWAQEKPPCAEHCSIGWVIKPKPST